MNAIYWLAVPDETLHNIGDHAQVLGIRKFLKEYFPETIVTEVKYSNVYSWVQSAAIPENALIFIQSGGHFGDFSGFMHTLRKKVLKRFPGNMVVQLPVSVYYEKSDSPLNDLHFFFKLQKLLLFRKVLIRYCCFKDSNL